MHDITEHYRKPIITLFEAFLADKDDKKLLDALSSLERKARKELKEHPRKQTNLWFRFFKNDTGATTIRDLQNLLSLPINRRYMIECMEVAVMTKSTLVYFS